MKNKFKKVMAIIIFINMAFSLTCCDKIKSINDISYDKVTPLEFLDLLKKFPNEIYTTGYAPEEWITFEHVRELIKYVDSDTPCARVVMHISSYLPEEQSTVGNEAMFLIEGFFAGTYPSALHSYQFTEKTAEWYRNISEELYVVETVEEFFDAIGSDRIIQMKPGTYQLSGLTQTENKYAKMQPKSDNDNTGSKELYIHDVENLIISGVGKEHVDLFTEYQTANVIMFENVKNVSVLNISAGHYPKKGGCYGGVAVFKDSSGICIEKCEIFGCGILGLELNKVENLNLYNSVITDCNSILTFSSSNNICIKNSRLVENRGVYLMNISGCRNIVFDNCIMSDNTAVCDGGSFFSVDTWPQLYLAYQVERNEIPSEITVKNSHIENNSSTAPHIIGIGYSQINNSEGGPLVLFENVVFEGNSFDVPSHLIKH